MAMKFAGASSLKQPVVVRVYKGEALEAVRQFENSQIVVGRSHDAHLQLQDEAVASLHAMIEERDGQHFLSDLGSQTGTTKNGQKVLEDKLVSGDEVKIGPYRIQFFIGVPKPAAPPKPAKTEPVVPPASVAFTPAIATEKPAVNKPSASTASTASTGATASTASPSSQSPVKSTGTSRPATQDKNSSRKKKTFAPGNPYKDLRDIIKPHKGTLVEVIVAWKDRVLSSKHFSRAGSVYMSSVEDADVVVPILSSRSKFELLKVQGQAIVCLTQEMTGELIREDGSSASFAELSRQNKLRNASTHFELDLKQGEMVRIGLQSDLISIFIRYTSEAPKPLLAPLLDMSSSEVTGVIMALAVSAILGLYMNVYTPSPLLEDEATQEEPIRKAIVQFTPPPKKQIVEVKDEPPKEKKVVVVKEKKEVPRVTPKPGIEKKGDPGAASDIKPNPTVKTPPNKPVASVKQGGAVKTSPKEGANMKSEKPDPKSMGLLATFGKGGVQKDLSKAYNGSGELAGMADAATGTAGNAENRAGDTLGSNTKDVGSGKGTSTVGISGVNTKGRGTGGTGYGTGGIGQKGNVQVNVGGQEADIGGGMDKEAIRRVIREHIREIRNCYERELQKSPDLYGKIVLEWDIEEEGRVSRCVVKSNALGNDAVAQCIASRLKTWKFPDPPKDQVGRVVFPFVFSSQ